MFPLQPSATLHISCPHCTILEFAQQTLSFLEWRVPPNTITPKLLDTISQTSCLATSMGTLAMLCFNETWFQCPLTSVEPSGRLQMHMVQPGCPRSLLAADIQCFAPHIWVANLTAVAYPAFEKYLINPPLNTKLDGTLTRHLVSKLSCIFLSFCHLLSF